MPESYRDRFDAPAVAAHAATSYARRGAPAALDRFASSEGRTAICVVADDRPGLLSSISAALVLSGLDVVDAEAYCRETSDGLEAVDVFWLEAARKGAPVDDALLDRARRSLVDALEGRLDETAVGGRREQRDGPKDAGDTSVRFLERADGGLAVLEIETGNRSGLLHAVTRSLFQSRVQIVRSEVRTVDGRVLDRFFVVEFDGAPIGPQRRLDIQVAVMSAIEKEQTPPTPVAEQR